MIGEREQRILELLVREYIRTAEPVSSERVASRMRGAVSSATVRNAFGELTEEGYIAQPHTSGGRVPRSRGYRFFVERILSEDDPDGTALPGVLADALMRESLEELQGALAHHARVLSYLSGARPIGFDILFREPEFSDTSHVRQIGRVLDGFDSYERAYGADLDDDSFEIVIGEENKVQPVKDITLVFTRTPEGKLFCIAGPTRMHYDKIIHVLNIWKKKRK